MRWAKLQELRKLALHRGVCVVGTYVGVYADWPVLRTLTGENVALPAWALGRRFRELYVQLGDVVRVVCVSEAEFDVFVQAPDDGADDLVWGEEFE